MAFNFSVIIAVFNKQEYVAEALESIINQSLDFKQNIQIILVDDKSTDDSLQILEEYKNCYPDNIVLITNDKNMGPAYSRNHGLKYAEGKFINFLDADDFISKNTFKHVYDFFSQHEEVDIVSIPIYYFGVKRGPHILNFKFKKDQVINLEENPSYIQLSGPSSFIRTEKIRNYEFNNNLSVSEDALLINQMLLDNPNIGFLKGDAYNYRKDGTKNSLISASSDSKSYFTSRIDEYFFKLINDAKKDNNVPKFIQHLLMYDLQWIVEIQKIDNLLDKDEIKTLYCKILEILTYIDDDVIFSQLSIPAHLKAHVLLMKWHGWDYLENKVEVEDNFNLNNIFIDNFRFKNDHEVEISGMLTNFTEDTRINAVVDDDEIPLTPINYPQRNNISLNFVYGFNHSFKVILNIKENSKIKFKTSSDDLQIRYNHTSRLNDISRYKISKHHLAIDNGNEIIIARKKYFKKLKLEFKTLKLMLKQRSQGWRTGVFLRLLSIIAYPFIRGKRIWIFMDLPTVAGDNALELFKYVNSLDTDVKTYFVLDKSPVGEYDFLNSSNFSKIKRLLSILPESEHYHEIKKIGNVVQYRSLKHRLYVLFCEFIITSHPDNTLIYPFWGNYQYISTFARSKTVFLQHGVTKDNISDWLNDFDKPLEMLVTVSDKETESFKNSNYGYSEDIIKILGFPRFDCLENNPKKEVIIMPSWRRYLYHLSQSDFVKSNFYKVFNELITDDELISYLKAEGYKVIFKPHRNLHKFKDTFTKHPDVIFDLDLTNYSETFNTASLIITDYSSISFDFAYLKKPIIYFQFDNGYHFDVEKAYFQYEKDGFGPVTKTHDEIKDAIISAVENNCVMDEKYIKRVEKFFKYRDKNNSKRVYEEILKLDTYY